jgi:hypothetical protein
MCPSETGKSFKRRPGHLRDREDDKLRRFERREADHDIDDPAVDIGLRGRLAVA